MKKKTRVSWEEYIKRVCDIAREGDEPDTNELFQLGRSKISKEDQKALMFGEENRETIRQEMRDQLEQIPSKLHSRLGAGNLRYLNDD